MSVAAKICRKMSLKTFALTAIGITIILCVYYANYTTDIRANQTQEDEKTNEQTADFLAQPNRIFNQRFINKEFQQCPKLFPADADINTLDVFKDFEFQVIIVPHSHNDPGWLKTFDNYFHYVSRQILNNMVVKLQQYKNLTFIWSEVAFLNAWWEEAHPSKQRAFRNLVNSGRLEIVTGGWVMTDEANAHVFAMVDQLIEGHQWIWTNLGKTAISGWSVDPFGHGSTHPYILASSGIKGTVIQRIHYAWKQWLALKQYGDFRWIPSWATSDASLSVLTHNQPFDIYSIKHSCGPHPYICLNFDFRKVIGEYTEYSIKAQAITDKNIKEKSELLLEQYARTGSLFPHNVVLMPLGDDFRYNVAEEWDQQYTNYIKLIDFINANKDTYKAQVQFGTPKDYFDEILKRYDQYPSLKGDFYVYSDIFSEGRPAYWSGYYTTRPFMKILDRELESSLRGAEILYTIALNSIRRQKLLPYLKILERDFEKLVSARRNLALFQHHDAITGTSKAFVMRDYGQKLFEGIRDTVTIQQNALQSLLFPNDAIKPGSSVILSDLERDSYEKLAKKSVILLGFGEIRKFVVYNSLAQNREQLIQVRCNTSNVKVVDDVGNDVVFQINPVWDVSEGNTKLWISSDEYEVVFMANLTELSLSIYSLVYTENGDKLSTIYCNKCHRIDSTTQSDVKSKFQIKTIPSGDIQLENHNLKILFNGNTGFMKSITRKHKPKIMRCGIQFGAYRSAQFHSGAYLFMPDPNERDIEKDVLQQYNDQISIIITTGLVSSEMTVVYGAFLVHSIAIYHTPNSSLSNGIYMENTVDFENPPKNRETELFMRLVSDIQNGEPPEFYTDQNGFQFQKRIKLEKIGIEGNYFPITTMAFIQDENMRLSLLTDHAQGAASWQPGYLEVMLDRRTLYDDSRGMGEGLVDNRKTINRLWLLVEDITKVKSNSNGAKRFESSDDIEQMRSFNLPTESNEAPKSDYYPLASLFANHLSNALNYPIGVFIVDHLHQNNVGKSIKLLDKPFPCDTHLMNLRTQPDSVYSQFPSSSALLVLHRQGYDCSVSGNYSCNIYKFETEFQHVSVKEMQVKTLTGIETLLDKVKTIGDIYIEPMALKTFNLTFV